jgi:hypothetical protein
MPRPKKFPPRQQGYQRMYGESNGNSRLREYQVAEIRARYARGESVATLAETYSVSVSTVFQVVARKTWRHVATDGLSPRRIVTGPTGALALLVGGGGQLHIQADA